MSQNAGQLLREIISWPMFALVAAVFAFSLINQWLFRNVTRSGNRNVHYWYIIGILSGIIVISLSIQWSDVKDLDKILGFAVSFAALILAIISIFQALLQAKTSIVQQLRFQ